MAMVNLRVEKLKSFGNVGGSLSHTYRTRPTKNADPARFDENTLQSSPKAAMAALKARMPAKRRKDAVIALEYFIGGSPEWFDGKSQADQDKYFADAKAWLEQVHGAENVIDFSIHRDEKTPHVAAIVVPLHEGKLNAKRFTGSRALLSKMQTDFAELVGKKHGLERGIEGSKAHHTTVKEYYAALAKPLVEHPTILAKALEPRVVDKGILINKKETAEQVAERLTRAMQKHYEPAIRAAQAAKFERKRADDLATTLRSIQECYGDFFEAIDAIPSPKGRKRALNALEGVKQALQREFEAEIQRDLQVEQMLQRAAHNMCLADTSLTEETALQRARDMSEDSERHAELLGWLEADQDELDWLNMPGPDPDAALVPGRNPDERRDYEGPSL